MVEMIGSVPYKDIVRHDTSVKTLGVIQAPTSLSPGVGDFIYKPV